MRIYCRPADECVSKCRDSQIIEMGSGIEQEMKRKRVDLKNREVQVSQVTKTIIRLVNVLSPMMIE